MNVTAIRYDLDHQPGFVSFEFRDTKNKIWTITDKFPVVGLPEPKDESNLPFEFEAPSRIIRSFLDKNDNEILKIEFLHHIESDDGVTEFEVFAKDYYS